jgi:hypothetical protein
LQDNVYFAEFVNIVENKQIGYVLLVFGKKHFYTIFAKLNQPITKEKLVKKYYNLPFYINF